MKAFIYTILLTTCLIAQESISPENWNLTDGGRRLSSTTEKISVEKISYSLGAVIGGNVIVSPKFVAGNFIKNIHIQILAMHDFDKHYQSELELNYTIFKKGNQSHSFGFGGGFDKFWKLRSGSVLGFRTDNTGSIRSEYVKLNYTFMWNWFIFQTGFATGNNNYRDGRLIIQLGYLYSL